MIGFGFCDCLGSSSAAWLSASAAWGLVISLGLGGAVGLTGVLAQPPAERQLIQLAANGEPTNRPVQLKIEADRWLLIPHRPSPIGGLLASPGPDGWPAELRIRLPLAGLEQLKCVTGEQQLELAVPSYGDHQPRQSLIDRGGERAIDAEHPRWLAVKPRGTDHQPLGRLPRPEAGEYFEVTLTPAWLTPTAEYLRLEWIDFYR
jgi:hypothetical protein